MSKPRIKVPVSRRPPVLRATCPILLPVAPWGSSTSVEPARGARIGSGTQPLPSLDRLYGQCVSSLGRRCWHVGVTDSSVWERTSARMQRSSGTPAMPIHSFWLALPGKPLTRSCTPGQSHHLTHARGHTQSFSTSSHPNASPLSFQALLLPSPVILISPQVPRSSASNKSNHILQIPLSTTAILTLAPVKSIFQAHNSARVHSPKLPKMPAQIIAPVPIRPMRKSRLGQPPMDLGSLNINFISSPVRSIQEQDWHVPAPPPPSPVSFRPEHFERSIPMLH